MCSALSTGCDPCWIFFFFLFFFCFWVVVQHGLITQVFTPNHRKLLSVTTVYWQTLPEWKKEKKGRERQRKRDREGCEIICLSICLYFCVVIWVCLCGFASQTFTGRSVGSSSPSLEGGRRGDIQAVDRDLWADSVRLQAQKQSPCLCLPAHRGRDRDWQKVGEGL